jgi:pilus assembly protein CpaE
MTVMEKFVNSELKGSQMESMLDPIHLNGSAGYRALARVANPRVMPNTTIVLICPSEQHRPLLTRSLEVQRANIVSSLHSYPAYNHLLATTHLDCDAFVVEIDTDADAALNLVETICTRKPSATVLVYSANSDPDLLVRSMRAGAREFLTGIVSPAQMSDALLRAAARRAEQASKRTQGKVLVFWGAKGGSGVTTIATNFSIALRNETAGDVALLDLNPQMGDIAVLLGITPEFTLADALLNPDRLDEEFVSRLTVRHQSGVSVIAAPDVYSSSIPVEGRSVGKLVDLIRYQFPYLVIDAGPGLGNGASLLFQMAEQIYLVTQADIPSLRKSQRFISYLQSYGQHRVELVLNRFDGRRAEFDDARLGAALGVPPQWKVPNDYAAVRRASNTGTPLILEKSPVAQLVRQMARVACGMPAVADKKKGFSFFG